MKKILALTLCLCMAPILGCPSATTTTPTAALAPGYSSQVDQTLGQTLGALSAFVTNEKRNYNELSVERQAPEKPYLNTLIEAVNVANATYLAFHQGTTTLAQAQTELLKAETAQSALVAQKGIK